MKLFNFKVIIYKCLPVLHVPGIHSSNSSKRRRRKRNRIEFEWRSSQSYQIFAVLNRKEYHWKHHCIKDHQKSANAPVANGCLLGIWNQRVEFNIQSGSLHSFWHKTLRKLWFRILSQIYALNIYISKIYCYPPNLLIQYLVARKIILRIRNMFQFYIIQKLS